MMEMLRRTHRCTRLLLAWVVLSLGVAIAAPVMQPQHFQVVCSASGPATLIAPGEEPGAPAGHQHGQDCSPCVLLAWLPEPVSIAAQRPATRVPVSPERVAVHGDNPSPYAARAPPVA